MSLFTCLYVKKQLMIEIVHIIIFYLVDVDVYTLLEVLYNIILFQWKNY